MHAHLCANPMPSLAPSLLARVLDRLEVDTGASNIDLLRTVYAAWCRRVPFDNVCKLIALSEAADGPLPGIEPTAFFESWLRHGTGGTCWAGSTALLALLRALGFEAGRAVATMLVAPDLPPNHGTVHVRVEGEDYLVDSSILFGEPLHLDPVGVSVVGHPAWGVRGEVRDGLWYLRWRPLNQIEGMDCRHDRFEAAAQEYADFYEGTRGWSPFNYQLTIRGNREDAVIGASFGNAITLHGDGSATVVPVGDADRRRLLIEAFGLSEEIVARLPDDRPTPPPPGSKTAERLAQ